MTEFINTYTLDLNNLTVKETEVEGDLGELLLENDGYAECEDQYIIFDCDGNEMCVNFTLEASGTIDHCPGDYWTPPSTDVDVKDVDVYITDVYFNDNDLTLPKEITSLLEKKIINLI